MVSVLAATAVWACNEYLYQLEVRSHYICLSVFFPFVSVLTAGAIAWLFSEQRSTANLPLLLMNCLIAASMYAMARQIIVDVATPEGDTWVLEDRLLKFLIYEPARWGMLSIAIWGSIATWERLMGEQSRPVLVRRALLTVAVVSLCIFYFTVGIFELAERSLRGRGPFSRYHGATLLYVRGSDRDYAFMVEVLEETPAPAWNVYFLENGTWLRRCLHMLEEKYGERFDTLLSTRLSHHQVYFDVRAGRGVKSDE